MTPLTPSYFHGWSPDGKFLVYTGGRNDKYDIYKISSEGGGTETRLTDSPGLSDGPEYTPDGKYIYYNSTRSGTMQLWRMKADGQDQEQVTNDEFNNWFPHVSPDGKWIAFLSYGKDVPPDGHPYYKQIYLRLLAIEGGSAKNHCLCLWRAGHDQCPIVVAGQHAHCVRQQHPIITQGRNLPEVFPPQHPFVAAPRRGPGAGRRR